MVSTYCCNNNSVVYNGAPAVHCIPSGSFAIWRNVQIRYVTATISQIVSIPQCAIAIASAIRNFYVLESRSYHDYDIQQCSTAVLLTNHDYGTYYLSDHSNWAVSPHRIDRPNVRWDTFQVSHKRPDGAVRDNTLRTYLSGFQLSFNMYTS